MYIGTIFLTGVIITTVFGPTIIATENSLGDRLFAQSLFYKEKDIIPRSITLLNSVFVN